MSARDIVEASAGRERLTLERVDGGVAWLLGASTTLDMPAEWSWEGRSFNLSEATEVYFDRGFKFEGFSGPAVVARTPGSVLCVVLDESGGVDGHWIFKIKLGQS